MWQRVHPRLSCSWRPSTSDQLRALAAVTVSFLTLAFGQFWHVVNMRQPESGMLVNEVTRNRYVCAVVRFCVLLLFGVVYIPGMGTQEREEIYLKDIWPSTSQGLDRCGREAQVLS